MFKRIASLVVLAVMLFAFIACSDGDNTLAKYKNNAKNDLDTYVENKGIDNYSEENWALILEILEDGKKAIDKAKNKTEVNTAFKNTTDTVYIKILEIEADEMKIFEDEVDDMIELSIWFFSSGYRPNAIKVMHSDPDVVFECSVDNGLFWDNESEQYTQKTSLRPGDTINWCEWEEGNPNIIEHAFAEIILKIDSTIIGYAVIEISCEHTPLNYSAVVLKSAIFPKVNGKYQRITNEKITAIIEEIKNK